jgi:hypothetical protein
MTMKRMLMDRRMVLGGIGVVAGSMLANKALAGSLEPPGPPGPTGRSTDELAGMIARPSGVSEPRSPVTGLPPSASSRYLISSSGSYCMTENLVATPGMNGIQITADNVDLDLQDFHLVGAGGGTPGDTSVAIQCTGQNICIYGGSIEGWAVGVQMDAASRFLLWDVTVLNATIAGYRLGTDGQAYDCDVYGCPTGFVIGGLRTVVEECGAWSCPVSYQCTGAQNLIIGNCATDSPNAFSIGAGNSFGPIVTVTGVGNIGGVVGSNHFLANFIY